MNYEVEESYEKSEGSYGCRKGVTFKNYTKFFGGNLELEHLHPPTHNI